MKKAFGIIVAILLCVALAVPVLGAANEFVPSITYKGYPELVSAVDADKADAAGCLVIVPVADADQLPADKKEVLLKVYEELDNGTMTLPYDKVEGVDADKMVIRELLEVYFSCDDNHASSYTLTFDLGVAADDVVVGMSYVNDEWVPAEEVTNNGDGTVTFVFADLCPIAIAVEG